MTIKLTFNRYSKTTIESTIEHYKADWTPPEILLLF